MASGWSSRTWVRRAAAILAVCAGILVVALIAAHIVIDAAFLEARLNQRLNASTNGLYTAEIGEVDVSPFLQSLEVTNVSVQADSAAAARLGRRNSLPRVQFAVELPSMSIDNIGYVTLLRRGGLKLDSLVARKPAVTITTHPGDASAVQRDSAQESLPTRISRALPYVDIDRLGIRQATVSMTGSRAGETEGLSLIFDDIRVDSTALADTSRVLFSQNIELAFDHYRQPFRDSLYSFQVRSLHASSRARSLNIESVELDPTLPDSLFVRRLDERDPRHHLDIGPVIVNALDYRALAEHQALDVHSIVLDSVLLDIYADRRVPKTPEPPPTMPHEMFQQIPFPVDLDTVRIRQGTIRYTVDVGYTRREAKLIFDLQSSYITHITNDPERMSPSDPAVVNATSYINGTGPLQVNISYPLLTSDFSLDFAGTMPEMNVPALNKILVPLKGIRVTSGTADSLWFEASVDNGRATGEFHGIYRNLKLEMLDREEQEQGLTGAIKTFVVNRAVLKNSNLPSSEGPLRVGTIQHEHVKENPFFKFLWKSLQTGIFSLLGL